MIIIRTLIIIIKATMATSITRKGQFYSIAINLNDYLLTKKKYKTRNLIKVYGSVEPKSAVYGPFKTNHSRN